MKNSKILQAFHETAKGLHPAKAISEITLPEFDQLCLLPVHELSPKKLRQFENKIMSASRFLQPF